MDEQTYLFVDGGHLRRHYPQTAQRWFGDEARLEVRQVKEKLQATKCFYYDCVDDIQGENESQESFEIRLREQEAQFAKIQEIYATHVQLGSMTGTRKNKRQKQVDILLAVDMLNHAFRRNM